MNRNTKPWPAGRLYSSIAVLLALAASFSLDAQTNTSAFQVECPEEFGDSDLKAAFGIDPAQKNYLVFNHSRGIIEWPVPAELQARDKEVFAILFACTAPEHFDYQIEAIPGDKVQDATFSSGTDRVGATRLESAASLTWRHDETFPLYRVTITKRKHVEPSSVAALDARLDDDAERAFDDMVAAEGEPSEGEIELFADTYGLPRDVLDAAVREAELYRRTYELHSYTFPVWVRTVGWKLSFSSGFGFSGLENPKYFLETVEADPGANAAAVEAGAPQTEEPAPEQKLVRRDSDAEDDFHPDLMALGNLQFPSDLAQKAPGFGWLKHFGLSFGVGIGEDSEPRYYFGPSINLGDHFVLTAGVAGGKVDTLPAGQELGAPPIDGDSTLSNLPQHFETEWFAGIAFRFRPTEKEFLGALSGVQKVPEKKESGDSG